MDEPKGIMPSLTQRLSGCVDRARQFPSATTMLAARSPRERAIKAFLFMLAMAVPLGFPILLLLFWHGRRVVRNPLEHGEPIASGQAETACRASALSPMQP